MNSCDCEHRIEVDNLENGEIINHTLLLIKGHIRQQRLLLPNSTTKKCAEEELVLRLRQRLVQHTDSAWELLQRTTTSRNGQFKLLCDLGQHVAVTEKGQLLLQLDFSFCNTLHQLELLYKPADTSNKSYRLQPLYITCSKQSVSEERVAENCEKINLNLRLVQCIYAEQLRSAGFGRRTFTINGDCEVFESNLTCEEVWLQNEEDLYQNFAKELLNSKIWGGESKLKFVAFISCTRYDGAAVAASGDFSYANIHRHLKGHAALGGGGLALFGAVYLYAWPQTCNAIQTCFVNNKEVDLTELPDDSNYRRTYGGVYATTLGALVHEIGHTFDLGHTKDGVMGNGFDYVNRVFTVDNLTEHLPDRIIQHVAPKVIAQVATRPRFTQLKRTTNSFLDKYREQKTSDSFYFTRNCAIILAHHKWFRNHNESADEGKGGDAEITYDAVNSCVISAGDNPLCLIEVRCRDSSLVKYWYELQSSKDSGEIYKFHLPKEALEAFAENHYLFVLTEAGLTKRLDER